MSTNPGLPSEVEVYSGIEHSPEVSKAIKIGFGIGIGIAALGDYLLTGFRHTNTEWGIAIGVALGFGMVGAAIGKWIGTELAIVRYANDYQTDSPKVTKMYRDGRKQIVEARERLNHN